MARRRKLYEGRSKVLFEGPEQGTIVQYFKDDTTSSINQKTGIIAGKGVLNNRISEHIMTKLEGINIPTHFMRRLNMREQLVRQADVIPLSLVVRNAVAGTLADRFEITEGTSLIRSIVEFHYKSQKLKNPLVTEEHIAAFNWATPGDLDEMVPMALRINDFLTGLFSGSGLRLIDFRLEFGRVWNNDEPRIILIDEISPDTCRLWDDKTGERMDKDRFRRDMGGVEEAYQEVARRLGILPESGPRDMPGPEMMQ